jgi:hypothetical protein
MKTISRMYPCLLLLGLIIVNVAGVNAQEISINQTFNADTVIMPFSSSGPVYSVKISGSVALLTDSSLIRVILLDNNDNRYLIYEAYPMITDDSAFFISGVCEETCFLDSVHPYSVRIDIIDAILTFGSLMIDTGYVANATALQEQVKWLNDSIKIDFINQRIPEEHMYWRAGRGPLLQRSFADREKLFGAKYNLSGLEFYKGGVFEFLFNRHRTPADPAVVSDFDWRNRHHANDENSPYWDGETYSTIDWRTGWITPIRDQHECLSCVIFAEVAAVEAYINLYFNNNDAGEEHKHQLDIDLSELQVMRCCGINNTGILCNTPTNMGAGLSEMQSDGVNEEDCMISYNSVYQNQTTYNPPCPSCGNPNKEFIKIQFYNAIGPNSNSYIQKELIKHGPLASLIPSMNHEMLLVGYKSSDIGDVVYQGTGPGDSDIVLDGNCQFLNSPVWIFKNSWGGADFKTISCEYTDFYSLYFPFGDIYRQEPIEIQFSDEDGDGYYWWGVHRDGNGIQINPNTFPNCPPGIAAADEDCNDWDVTSGPYNEDPNAGVLFSCKPNPCVTQATNPLIINEQTSQNELIWNNNRHYDRNIIIDNTTLTIHSEVFFSPGARIIILPGGKLVLEGNTQFPARLSSGCGQLWGGIEVHGDPLLRQEINNGIDVNHGYVKIVNGIVENARCGIRVANPGYNPDAYSNEPQELCYPSGGIVQVKLATFRNNQTGVSFYPYRNFDENNLTKADESYLTACTFETTSPLLNQSTPGYFLKLDGVNGIKITGCTLQNKNYQPAPLGPEFAHRGRGIYCYNADLYVHDTTGYPAKFEKLEYGVYAMHSGMKNSYVSLKNAQFNGNQNGAYFSGYSEINPVEIRNNHFNHTQNFNTSNPQNTDLYGLYLNNCSGYRVSLNTFNGSGFSGEGVLYGAIINNSGAHTNFIYKNVFNTLDYGLQSQNRNRGYGYLPDKLIGGPVPYLVETGLCFKCNDFTRCKNDITIVADELDPPPGSGIVKNQGTNHGSSSATAAKDPAGNTFTPVFNFTGHENDINISTSVENIIYLHHHDLLGNRLIPDKENYINNPDKVTLQEHPSLYANYNPSLSCPPDEYPGFDFSAIKGMVDEARIKIDSLSELLSLFVDDGSTEDKNEQVLNSAPGQAFELYQDLLGTSPYLSDTVLASAVDKENVLSNEMISDILIANPQAAKNEDILNSLDDRLIPLTDSAWNEIMKGVDTIAARERLEAEISGWIASKERCMNELMAICLVDSNRLWGPDSLLSLLNHDPVLSSQYKLAHFFIDKREYTTAGEVLQMIPEHFSLDDAGLATNERYISLLPLLEQIYNDSSGFIVLDSVQRIILEGIAQLDYDFPGAMARDILISQGLTDYREPVLAGSGLKSGKSYHPSRTSDVSGSLLKIYPNPCQSYTTIEYNIKATGHQTLLLSLLNFENKIIHTSQLTKPAGTFILPLKGLNPGIYILRLERDGKSIGTQKLVVIH